jgi:DNA processing protein
LTALRGGAICFPFAMTVDNLAAAVPRKARMPSFPVLQVNRGASSYPVRLERRLGRPPAPLFYKGALPVDGPTVAIVGARAATAEGCTRAAALARRCGEAGYQVVSGGAIGIDAAAHEGALTAGAPTFALLGCGVDVVYPDRHVRLFERIAAAGGLLSEYPPGTAPRAGQFPARNRLIAALADAVVVVEAGLRSGALITARLGHENGLPVLAVRGSPGADALIASGVAPSLRLSRDPVSQIQDALAGKLGDATPAPVLEDRYSRLAAVLVRGARSAEEVAARLELPMSRVMSLLSEAELEGWVKRLPGGRYEVSRVH